MGLLRLLLACAVVFAHSGPLFGLTLTGGTVAVQTFFMISGFYMALILSEKYVGPGSLKVFVLNRVLRLFPAYWAVLLATLVSSCLAMVILDNPGRLESYVRYWEMLDITSLLFLVFVNTLIVGQDWAMFMGVDPGGALYPLANFAQSEPQTNKFLLLPQAWSLGIELTFYAIAPFLVRRKLRDIVLLVVAAIALRYYLYTHLDLFDDPWSYRFFPLELGMFLLGALGYKVYARYKSCDLGFLSAVLSYSFIGITFAYQFVPELGDYGRFPLKIWFYYLLAAVSIPFLFVYSKKNRVDRYIGELSYPVYISHVLVIGALHSFGVHHPLPMLVGTIILSVLLLHYVIEPVDSLRHTRCVAANSGAFAANAG